MTCSRTIYGSLTNVVRGVSATSEGMNTTANNNNKSNDNIGDNNNNSDAIFGPSTILCLDCLPLFALHGTITR